jgi:DNA-binding NarL/FixJ family response regulator
MIANRKRHEPPAFTKKDGMTREEIIRILLVDDVELVRHTLRTILLTHPRFAIVGEACDGEEALTWVQRCDPSVVVMDIQMPRLNGIQATALIKRFFPHVIVVGLSVHATEDLRQEMIAAGANSVLSKDRAGTHLLEEITKAVDYRSAMLS